jgi:putative ABC transport system permease protein
MTGRAPVGERVFRALLHLYPASFRKRFGDEMLEFYRERRDEQRQRHGARIPWRLWAHLFRDLLIAAPLQHVHSLRHASAREFPWASPDYPPETRPMEVFSQDVRYALRSLTRQPGFALVAALTLALGIGATTSIFSVIEAVVLRPLPWPDPDRLVMIYGTRGENRQGGVVYLDYLDWREQSRSFEELGILRGQSINLTGVERPDRLIGSFATAGTLRILGASTVEGRLFTDAETEVATRQPVAVISEATWRTRFGSRPDMVGQTVTLNGMPMTVVGIMRPDLQAPFGTPDVWLPVGYYPNRGDLETRGRSGVWVIGRLRPGISRDRAQADLDAISARLAALHPATNAGTGANVQLLTDEIVGDSRGPLAIVFASVAVVLLISCANVANLQLARSAARRRELSVRAALGARRSRLLRQLLTESVALSVVGGVAGVALAHLVVRWFAVVLPDMLPVYGQLTLNGGVLLFAAVVTIATGVLFGAAPAWQGSRVRLQDALTARGGSAGARLRIQRSLVVGQLALCVVLLVAAGLLTRSLFAIAAVRPGFDPANVLTLQFRLPAGTYDTEQKIADMFTRTLAEIRAVPGVEHAALVRATPLNGNGETLPYEVQGGTLDPEQLPQAHRNIVSSEYFETLKISRLAGRDFTDTDRLGSMPVAIVNQQLASRIAPEGSPIGRQLRLHDGDEPVWATIVGVVGNAKHFRLTEQPLDQVYIPYQQKPLIFTEVVVRATQDPMAIANAVREAIWRVDRDQPVWRIRPVTMSIDAQLGSRRFMMALLASFAVLAVVLAAIGVYGVMSYLVARRTQEMGVRMALGARGSQVVGMVLGQGARTIVVATALGLGVALLATRLLESQLYGVQSRDPLTFLVAPVLLASVALIACWLPARRASHVDPVVALRSE